MIERVSKTPNQSGRRLTTMIIKQIAMKFKIVKEK
jgi:hypothetical protein